MATTTTSMHLRRACGFRKAGGTYVTTKTSAWGAPIENFLVDPPYPIFLDQFPSLSAQGLNLIEATWRGQPGVYDIFDWVGTEYYPYVPDFVEEARLFGTSRMAQPNLPFGMITKNSWHFFMHSRASVVDPTKPYDNYLGIAGCPKDIPIHVEQPQQVYEMCTGLLWEMVGNCKDPDKRVTTITMPCSVNSQTFQYSGALAPRAWDVEWQLAIFMRLKPTAIEVVEDKVTNRHERALKLLEQLGGGIPYYKVEE